MKFLSDVAKKKILLVIFPSVQKQSGALTIQIQSHKYQELILILENLSKRSQVMIHQHCHKILLLYASPAMLPLLCLASNMCLLCAKCLILCQLKQKSSSCLHVLRLPVILRIYIEGIICNNIEMLFGLGQSQVGIATV